jgi:deazaflavin-dependent oxidoreductase (nitroreductase family)
MADDQRAYNERMIGEFRATRDSPEGPFPGRPLLLLATTGAKTGLRRTTPLMYLQVDGKLLVIGSAIGAPRHPDWCHNLMANPRVTIEIGKETYDARARVATGAERARLWEGVIAQAPFFIEHQAKTKREIPVIVIERLAA